MKSIRAKDAKSDYKTAHHNNGPHKAYGKGFHLFLCRLRGYKIDKNVEKIFFINQSPNYVVPLNCLVEKKRNFPT